MFGNVIEKSQKSVQEIVDEKSLQNDALSVREQTNLAYASSVIQKELTK